jgi:DNA-binding transcriptional LysR family regulator
LDLKTLETFVWVTLLGSFRGAAARLNTTQPAISQRIARLEQELGADLLDRNGRSIALTPQGRVLLGYARRMIALRDELVSAVSGGPALSGVLRIGTSETLVYTWLPDLIQKAGAAFPRLVLEMEVDITPRLIERLLNFELDLAFMVGPVVAPEVQSVPVSTYPVGFIASPAKGLGGKKISIEELSQWPIVTFPRRTQPFQNVARLFQKLGPPPVRLHATASLATATRMAIDGFCIAVMPPVIVTLHIERGELEILDVESRLPDLLFVAAWLTERHSPAATALVEMARQTAFGR